MFKFDITARCGMNKVTVAFETATYAFKAKNILSRLGIKVRIIKTNGSEGCTHGIETDHKNLYTIISELKKREINYKILDN